jgi:hypothetical protein
VVCGKIERWDDHGVWRCMSCWPPGSLAARRPDSRADAANACF